MLNEILGGSTAHQGVNGVLRYVEVYISAEF